MAPEQVLHGTANALTDVFSFGMLAYELIMVEAPFRGDSVGSISYRVVYEPAAPPSQRVDGLPRVYDDIFGRVLSKELERRLSSATAFVRALESGRDRRSAAVAFDPLDDQARDLARLRESMPRLDDETCVVQVRTEPDGAQVWWNGVERGMTPLRICESNPGPHSLKLVRDGYAPMEAGFMVPQAPSLRLQFTLSPATPSKVLEFRPRRED